jgi:hypothetical protein
MIGKLDKAPQLDIFRVLLKQGISKDHELMQLSGTIKWDSITSGLAVHYSPDKGRKAIPVRKLAGLLILKHIYGGSDNSILQRWLEDSSFQYFCGEVYFSDKPVVNRFDMVNFRRRIGEKGMAIIFYPELLHILNRMKHSQKAPLHKAHSQWHFLKFFRQLLLNSHPVAHYSNSN